jgi:hypothetical protein
MQFGVLGAIEACRDGEILALGGPKQRALLAFLLLHAAEPVSRDRLIEALWGERPPPGPAARLTATSRGCASCSDQVGWSGIRPGLPRRPGVAALTEWAEHQSC